MKTVINCLCAWGVGWSFGLMLGFYSYSGRIFYDLGAGIRAAGILACAFAISALWAQLFRQEEN